MNDAPGQVNADNPLIPFAQFDTLHFARFVILDDKTLDDVRVYGVTCADLSALSGVPGRHRWRSRSLSWRNWSARAGEGLRTIFSCCSGFAAQTDLVRWMRAHETSSDRGLRELAGANCRRVREEAALREALETHLESNASEF